MHKLYKLVILVLLSTSNASVADVIVRMEIQQGAAIDNVDVRLYDGEAPVTVTNFLNYVNDGDYDQSFIHRSDPGFVIQGGGFIFDPTVNDGTFSNNPLINDFPGGLQPVQIDPPIVNEFSRSNLRGTVSMAKLPGDPDSATSQWFINLADNLGLDSDNGGYTVFGDVLNNGMMVIDTIASQPIYNRTDIHGAFAELPLVDYVAEPIKGNNLLQINRITELFTISPDIDYGVVTTGSNVQPEITIINTGNDVLQIGSIGDINPVADPFRIFDFWCANSIILPGDQCSFMVLFSPDSVGIYNDSFNIEIVNYGLSYEVSLHGEGGAAVDEPDIQVSFSSVNYGQVDVLESNLQEPYSFPQFVENKGNLDLTISSIDIGGKDATEISISGSCIGLTSVSPGNFCTLDIDFYPLTPGDKYAEVSINTNDPDENPFTIPLRATASGEDDGVPAWIEDAGPNSGDGNNDDILDSKQSNVATLVDSYGNYVTYLTVSGYRFSNMAALMPSDIGVEPEGDNIGSGIFDFTVEGLIPGQGLEIGVIIPVAVSPITYYIYGPSVDDTNPHWYEFNFDGETGAAALNNVTFTTSDGRAFERNVLKVTFIDGGRGDGDMTVNGVIAVTSGMSVAIISEEGSGSFNILLLLFISVVLIITRLYHVHQN